MSRIHLTIDRLSFPNAAGFDRKALLVALEGELRGILSEPAGRAAWATPHRTPVLRLRPVALEKGPAGSRKFGTTLARAIGKGLNP